MIANDHPEVVVSIDAEANTVLSCTDDAPQGVRYSAAHGGYVPPHYTKETVVSATVKVTAEWRVPHREAAELYNANKINQWIAHGRDVDSSVMASRTGLGVTAEDAVRQCADQFERDGLAKVAAAVREFA